MVVFGRRRDKLVTCLNCHRTRAVQGGCSVIVQKCSDDFICALELLQGECL